ncbi:hypothetical protein [Roseateles sp. MS654]|uniref:hypothetical protein n=1 Tax=Roseateles sp. MS654 TaxID=3412685 RepID=UPI003C2ECA50
MSGFNAGAGAPTIQPVPGPDRSLSAATTLTPHVSGEDHARAPGPSACTVLPRSNGGVKELAPAHQNTTKKHLAEGAQLQFEPIVVEGETWTFEHLRSFTFPYNILTAGAELTVYVDVVFSCHCFSRELKKDEAWPAQEWVYTTDKETRILDRTRYRHSREVLPDVIKDFDARKILLASDENYMTIEVTDSEGVQGHYQVFFTVRRKEGVKKRVELKVQSAYFVDYVHRQAQPASKRRVRFKVIVAKAYERKKLRPGK